MASYKAFQEVAEAVLDVAVMVLKDAGIPPKDDYHNLERLVQEVIFTDEVAKHLAEVNGLRNRLVHEYNGLWDDVAIGSAAALCRTDPDRHGGTASMDDQELVTPFKGRCMAVLLWGSHARGEATGRSDVDVCVVAGPAGDAKALQSRL